MISIKRSTETMFMLFYASLLIASLTNLVVCSDNEIKTEVKELLDDEDQMSPLTVKELKNLYLLDLLKDLIDAKNDEFLDEQQQQRQLYDLMKVKKSVMLPRIGSQKRTPVVFPRIGSDKKRAVFQPRIGRAFAYDESESNRGGFDDNSENVDKRNIYAPRIGK